MPSHSDRRPNDPWGRVGRGWWLAVLVIMSVAGGVRVWQLHHFAFDSDEVFELLYPSVDLAELITRRDGFPPVYRLVVGSALLATGDDRAARWVSVVVGVLGVGTIAVLARQIAGPRAGLFAAGLLGVSACHVLLSQHARAYALYVLLCAWVLIAGWRLRPLGADVIGGSQRRTEWAVFLGLSWLAMATHYLAAIPIALVGIMLLLERSGAERGRACLMGVLLATLAAPLTVCLLGDIAEAPGYKFKVGFDKEAYVFSYFWLISGYTLGPSVTELREMTSGAGMAAMAPWAALVGVVTLVLGVSGWRRLSPRARLWTAVLMIAPPALAALLSVALQTGYNYRYIVWMLLPLTVLLAAGAAVDRPKPWTTAATCGLAALGVFALANRHLDPRYFEQDFNAARERIAEAIAEETADEAADGPLPIVLASPTYYAAAVHYTMPAEWGRLALTMHPEKTQNWDETLAELAIDANRNRPVYLIREWYPDDHPRAAAGAEQLERFNATFVERVCPNTELFRVPSIDRQ